MAEQTRCMWERYSILSNSGNREKRQADKPSNDNQQCEKKKEKKRKIRKPLL